LREKEEKGDIMWTEREEQGREKEERRGCKRV